MGCACGCNCCECPCPSALPTVLRTWTGSRDFTADRDIRQMPGWTEELQRFFALAPCGYLWRVVGWDWQQIPFAPAPPSGWPEIGVGVVDGEVLSLGVGRNGLLYGNYGVGILGSAFAGVGGLRLGTDASTWGRKAGYFGGFVVAQPGPNNPPPWFWTGEITVAGHPPHHWATYELQLGVIRCECRDGLYVVWPADGVSKPAAGILSVLQPNGVGVPLIQRLQVPRTATRGIFTLAAAVAAFPGNGATPIELAYDASNADVKTAVEALTYYQSGGMPVFTAVSVTGGPLPSASVLIEATPTHPDPTFAALRIAANWDRLRLRRNGFECRRMTPLEEDARAWAGNVTNPLIPMPCQVEVLTDYGREIFAPAFDRLGYVERGADSGAGLAGAIRLHSSDFDGVSVLILGAEHWVDQQPPEFGTSESSQPRLGLIAAWLSQPGRVLVLNGVRSGNSVSGPCVQHSAASPYHYQTGGFNSVLTAIGAGTTLYGIGIPTPLQPGDIGCDPQFQGDVSVAVTRDNLGTASRLAYTIAPTSAVHPLMEHATGPISWSESASPSSAPWSLFALETIGRLVPSANATVLYELTAATTSFAGRRTQLAQTLPAVVVEPLASGSWVIVCGLLHVPGYGASLPAPDVLAHVPTAFLADVLAKLPY